MKSLAEELRNIIQGDDSHEQIHEEDDENLFTEDDEGCDGPEAPCWHLQEASQFVAEDMAGVMGLDPEILSMALTEAMKCDSECGKKYRTAKGDFKGGKGDAFDTCEKYVEACCSGVKDPAAFCAYLGRRAGKIG